MSDNLDAAVGLLVGLVNGATDLAAAVSFVQSRFSDKAAGLHPVPAKNSGWQAIATAPKDNSLINLIGRTPGGRWVAPVGSRRNMISADAGVDQWLDWEHLFAPTHWCAIPAAPSGPEALASKDAEAATARPPNEPAWLNEDPRVLPKAHRG